MDATENQYAIRRSSRLPLEVPVLLTSLDPGLNFSERCNTTLVNAHGCGMISPRGLKQGVRVRLEIVTAKRHTTARVAEVVPLGGEPETWLVGLELDVPGNFWGIEYAPADWRIEEAPAPASQHRPADHEWGATAKTPQRRWHLTDISAGACYLESASPFPADTPVILSIRDSEQECLLEGVVRVSHAQTGMGVEFSRIPGQDQRSRVEDLIGRLTARRDVPKIFVGRKETAVKDIGKATSNTASTSPAENQVPDPLLDLVRSGASLSGTDISGRPLDQRVMTINISRRGALMEGVHGMLKLGDEIFLSRLQKKEAFRVAWVGGEGSPVEGQIGVSAVDPTSTFWDEVLEASASAGLEATSIRGTGGAADD